MSHRIVKLDDICTKIVSGGTPKSTIESFYNPKEIPWLKTGEVNYSRIYDTATYISQEGLDRSSAKLIPINSVIVAMYGQGDTAGRVAINKIPLSTNQACCNLIIDNGKANYEYIYYLLSMLYEKLVSLKNGGAQPNLNVKTIKNIEILLPDLKVQNIVASILSAYDNLIENNQKQIKLLEEAAQRLYKEWFIDLRFPGHENVEIVDGVPAGWNEVSMDKIAEYLNGYAFKPSDWYEDGKPIIKIKELNEGITAATPRNDGAFIPDKYNISAGDIIFSWSATLTAKIWDAEDGLLNQHLFKVTPKKGISREFVLQSILRTLDLFRNLTTGSTMKHIQRGKLKEVFVCLPSEHVMNLYAKIAEPYRGKILNLNKQNLYLTEARDRLLPKLMSGEIEV